MPKILIIDNGEYTWLAEFLGRQKVQVAYYSPWENGFPVARMVGPGSGLPNVTRINEPLIELRENAPDLVIVPDLNHHDLEALCRDWKIPTFGSGAGAELEQNRLFLKEFLAEAMLPVGDYTIIDGLDDLEEYLQKPENEDKWIKVSTFRGDLNTFHHEDWEQTRDWLAYVRAQLGPQGDAMQFLVEDPLETELEVSIEGIFIDGKLLEPFTVGVEIKDAGEAGYWCPSLRQLPEDIQDIIAVLGDYFAEHQYRNFFAVEIRLMSDGTPYVTDLACRMPVPPGASMVHGIKNLIEVMIEGAEGRAVPLEVGKLPLYYTEIELESRWRVNNFLRVNYPEEFNQYIALFNHCIIDGERWCLPHVPTDPEMGAFAAVFAFDPSLEKASEQCQAVAKEIKAIEVHYRHDVLKEAQEQLEKLKDYDFK